MIEQPRRWPFRIGQAAALLVTTLLGLFDILTITADLALPLRVALPIAAAAVWFPVHRHRSRLLPALAGGLGAASVVTTGVIVVGIGSAEHSESWGLAESAGIMLVLVVVARRGT